MAVKYVINGKQVSEKQFLKNKKGFLGGAAMVAPPACWPLPSRSMSVARSQKREAEASAANKGVPTEFRIIGRRAMPIFTSKQHRKKYCRAYKVYDMDAGYGDPTPD